MHYKLTDLSYDEWLDAVFNHPPPLNQLDTAWYWADDVEFEVTEPAKLVDYFTRLCKKFCPVVAKYGIPRVNQGLWLLFAASPIRPSPTDCLVDVHDRETMTIPETQRLLAIRSIYYVYADFVAIAGEDQLETCFDMWWDEICHSFWSACRSARREPIRPNEVPELIATAELWTKVNYEDLTAQELSAEKQQMIDRIDDYARGHTEPELTYDALDPTEKRVLDTIFGTLQQILALGSLDCQAFALHGIGHSGHPDRVSVVQKYIDRNGTTLGAEHMPWLEACRDGTVL